ncbi:MAG: carbohydrate kinase family protein, partial [Lachnospiraceae bacterium]
MMKNLSDYVYLYGMVMSTHSFLLNGDFPKADGYGEIREKHYLLGGETGTAAAVLASLGVNSRLAGTHLGNLNRDMILEYFQDKPVDTSELVWEDFDGVIDHVFISGNARTCFGEFHIHFGRKEPFYAPPVEESVKNAVCIGADP